MDVVVPGSEVMLKPKKTDFPADRATPAQRAIPVRPVLRESTDSR